MRDLRIERLEGKRFGSLTCIKYLHGKSKYRCQCDCGNLKDVYTGDLKSGKTKSCGCLKKDKELNLVGKKFNKLLVVEKKGKKKGRNVFKCICDCGTIRELEGREIKNGRIKSCGCGIKEGLSKANMTHGMSRTRIYNIWQSMKKRCYNKNCDAYKNYGARGITVCEEWRNNFSSFHQWAVDNGYSNTLTIERKDVNGNYEPLNCSWATTKEQSVNKRNVPLYSHNGETKDLKNWCLELGLNYSSVWRRINYYGYDFDKAIGYNVDSIKHNK